MSQVRYLLLFIVVLIPLSACTKNSEEILMVKGGTLGICPNATVEQMVDGFFDLPRWESGTTEDGQDIVNIYGGMTYSDKAVEGVVQFFVNKKNNSFEYNAFEMNGIPQNQLIAGLLLKEMCKSVQNEKAENDVTDTK